MPLFFWALLGVIGKAAAAVGGAALSAGSAIGGATEAAGSSLGGAASTAGAAIGGAAKVAGSGIGGIVGAAGGGGSGATAPVTPPPPAPTSTPAPLSQTDAALTQAGQEDFVEPTAPPATQNPLSAPAPPTVDAPSSLEAPPPPTTRGSNPPEIQKLLKPSPTGTELSPQSPAPSLSDQFGVEGGQIGPDDAGLGTRLRASFDDLMDDIRRSRDPDADQTDRSKELKPFVETFDTAEKIKEVADKFGAAPQPPSQISDRSAEQSLGAAPVQNIAPLQRVATSSLGLARGGKDEPPLTVGQLQGFQQSSIQELIAELRTQRRLFG